MSQWIHYIALPAAVASASTVEAAVYHSVASAQKACFPGDAQFVSADLKLTPEQRKAIEKSSGVRVRLPTQKTWRVEIKGSLEGWFFVDEVLGKHEFITYALALGADGRIRSVEIMEYRENYGSEVRNADWRAQFQGKQWGADPNWDSGIKTISGATLSCRHVTEGVKRLLALHALLLKS